MLLGKPQLQVVSCASIWVRHEHCLTAKESGRIDQTAGKDQDESHSKPPLGMQAETAACTCALDILPD